MGSDLRPVFSPTINLAVRYSLTLCENRAEISCFFSAHLDTKNGNFIEALFCKTGGRGWCIDSGWWGISGLKLSSPVFPDFVINAFVCCWLILAGIKCVSISANDLKTWLQPGALHSNRDVSSLGMDCLLFTSLSFKFSSKKFALVGSIVGPWCLTFLSLCEKTFPLPIPQAFQAQIQESSKWTLWKVLMWSNFFINKLCYDSSTLFSGAVVPLTGCFCRTSLISLGIRMSCPSQQYVRMAVFIEQRIRSHMSFPLWGSE